ncbi:hypothetical protein GCM10011579_082530 [Streptomyces albiflavescens]|uniref:Uncharacterized protein n=1 Tax=Streptomyces albiflavescens TaxID=1623582 RepID=A0A917YCA6_9ACTN|nr:hypothetical protein GCM10011579_082530 [Streptomyces albiflavescens]
MTLLPPTDAAGPTASALIVSDALLGNPWCRCSRRCGSASSLGGRGRHARGDAAGAQGVGVDDAAVAGGVHDVDITVVGDAVQVVAGGVAAIGQATVLVAEVRIAS